MGQVARRQLDESNQGWISPSGEYHPVPGLGHREWLQKSFPGEDPDRKHFELMGKGWIRKSARDSYEIGDEKHLPAVIRHVRTEHPEVQDLHLDVTPSWRANRARVWTVPVAQPGRKRLFPQESRAYWLIRAKLLEAIRVDNTDRNALGHVADNGNVDYLGYTVHMKPSEFLQLNPERGHDRPASLEHLRTRMQAGDAIASPFLSVKWHDDKKHWQVIQHEGRGRMMVAHEDDPEQEVPVHVFPRDGDRARHLDDQMVFAPIHPDSRRKDGAAFMPRRVRHLQQDKLRPVSEAVTDRVINRMLEVIHRG